MAIGSVGGLSASMAARRYAMDGLETQTQRDQQRVVSEQADKRAASADQKLQKPEASAAPAAAGTSSGKSGTHR
ncbi:MAG: hypothetical protein JXA67_03210, partial [Micromonosporaceae bacterium]|nr:hypothetical protein [Micromonosporaceae bacterium]